MLESKFRTNESQLDGIIEGSEVTRPEGWSESYVSCKEGIDENDFNWTELGPPVGWCIGTETEINVSNDGFADIVSDGINDGDKLILKDCRIFEAMDVVKGYMMDVGRDQMLGPEYPACSRGCLQIDWPRWSVNVLQ